MKMLHLLPYYNFTEGDLAGLSRDESHAGLFGDRERIFLSSGTAAIKYVLHHLGLSGSAEVFVTTTSGSDFVSTCVSETVNEVCTMSRGISANTKLIFVIHEFGIPHPEIKDLVRLSKDNNIPLLEDVAHSLTSTFEGQPLGMFGDYSLHSLPKIFPVQKGGLLTGIPLDKSNPHFDTAEEQLVRNSFEQWVPYVFSLAEKRRAQYRRWHEWFGTYGEVYDAAGGTPFIYTFKHPKWREVYAALDIPTGNIMFGRTYNEEWVSLPCNEFLSAEQMEFARKAVEEVINE